MIITLGGESENNCFIQEYDPDRETVRRVDGITFDEAVKRMKELKGE